MSPRIGLKTMDVYHKVLARLFEITGGKETVDVDFVDLLKKEGFFAAIDDIREYMSTEAWITESSKRNFVRLTHWGVAEARRSGTGPQNDSRSKDAAKVAAGARELSVLCDELARSFGAEKLRLAEAKVQEISSGLRKLSGSV